MTSVCFTLINKYDEKQERQKGEDKAICVNIYVVYDRETKEKKRKEKKKIWIVRDIEYIRYRRYLYCVGL